MQGDNMKNFFIITSIGLLLILPLFVTAAVAPGGIPTYEQLGIKEKPPVEDVPGLINAIAGIVKWVYTIFFIVAVMFILIAAFNYLTAGGQPEKIKSAHTQLIYAAIAVAIALLAVGATAIIKDVLKGGGSAAPAETIPEVIPEVPVPPGYYGPGVPSNI